VVAKIGGKNEFLEIIIRERQGRDVELLSNVRFALLQALIRFSGEQPPPLRVVSCTRLFGADSADEAGMPTLRPRNERIKNASTRFDMDSPYSC